MPKNLQNCPSCYSQHLHVYFTVVRTARCDVCKDFEQYRIVNGVEGGALMLAQLIDYFISNHTNGDALQKVLQNLLAKVRQHNANSKAKERR
jgi:hypothetical protein